MDDDLPLEYDVIVIGTGMTESIIAAAASRIGKKVLHLDSDDYYGGMWASFNFDSFLKFIETKELESDTPHKIGISNVSSRWFIKNKSETDTDDAQNTEEINSAVTTTDVESIEDNAKENVVSPDQISDDTNDPQQEIKNVEKCAKLTIKNYKDIKWTQQSIREEYRKFNIDLAPKLLFARGDLVELLISSNIARYTEFKCVNRVLTWLNGIEPVPCSRADVFATKHVSVVEKRMLMKLLSSLMEYNEADMTDHQEIENKTFKEYLKNKKLTHNLIHYVLYAIAGGSSKISCKEGILKCKKFLNSLGRYGNTPFLWSMYGCGELPQGFCRLCAVYGGIYYLNRPIDEIVMSSNNENFPKCVTVKTNNKTLKCEHLVMSVNKAPAKYLQSINFTKGISRAIFITNRSILEFEKESLTLFHFPPVKGKHNPVTIIELGSSTFACPKGLYLIHMTCEQSKTALEDLQCYAEKLLSFEEHDFVKSNLTYEKDNEPHVKPQVLWCVYFNATDTYQADLNISDSNQINLCSGPDIELDFDNSVRQARQIFEKICPNAEFLPRAPDPDEIIFDGEDSNAGPIFERDVDNKDVTADTNSVEMSNAEEKMEINPDNKDVTTADANSAELSSIKEKVEIILDDDSIKSHERAQLTENA